MFNQSITCSTFNQMSFQIHFKNSEIKNTTLEILDTVRRVGAKGFLVGGCIRDALLDIPAKDIDIEVYGLELKKLEFILKEKFLLNYVGKNFGVLKIRNLPIDVSIPRKEKKIGLGYKGFEIETDPHFKPKEACARRDFTINAILYDPLNETFIDPFDGIKDLKNKILRHTTEKFSEDPLRVLRAMQFIARFSFQIASESLKLCQQISIENLSRERIFEEWKKLLLKGKKISLGLDFLKQSTWLRYFPELEDLSGCKQYKEWHPEGDVFVHTSLCLDAFVEERDFCKDEKENLIVGLGVLCHDFGKPATSQIQPDGRITAHKHDIMGVNPTLSFLDRLTNQKEILKGVELLVRYHMIPDQFFKQQVSDAAILRLSNKVGSIRRLLRVCKADKNGRGEPYNPHYPTGEWLLEKAEILKVTKSPIPPLLKGRHLIKEGLAPNKKFGNLLEIAYQAQINGEICTVKEAIKFLKEKNLL